MFHDPVLSNKLCCHANGKPLTAPIPVRELTAAEITSDFDCGAKVNANFPQQKPIPHSRIPTLETVFEWALKSAPDLTINIELKMQNNSHDPDPAFFAEKILALIHKYNWSKKAIVQSFDFGTIRATKQLAPNQTLSCLFESQRDFLAETLEIGAQFIAPHFNLLIPQIVHECHQKNIGVIAWTVNDSASWRKVISLGVDWIITDYPRQLASFMKDRNG